MAMKKLNHVQPGDPITASLWNEVSDRIARFANLQSASPYLRIYDSPFGKSLSLAFPEPTYARLSGSTSPYSFVEVRDGPGGTWVDMPNGDSGTSNVWEINGKSGLGGKVVEIHWTAARDWRFQFIGYGCVADANHVCACGCLTPIPKVFYIGDTNGTHTLTYTNLSPDGWFSPPFNVPGQDLYLNVFGTCNPPFTGDLPYRYRLLLDCATMKWKLQLEFPSVLCPNPPGPDIVRYSGRVPPLFVAVAEDEIDVDCNDFSMLSFTLPTSVPSVAMPGGGGPLTAVP